MRIIRKPDKNISKEMIGLFFEDINYAADGGLYAEMIENRSFEAKEAVGVVHSFYTVDDPGYAWNPVCGAEGNAPRMQYGFGFAALGTESALFALYGAAGRTGICE